MSRPTDAFDGLVLTEDFVAAATVHEPAWTVTVRRARRARLVRSLGCPSWAALIAPTAVAAVSTGAVIGWLSSAPLFLR